MESLKSLKSLIIHITWQPHVLKTQYLWPQQLKGLQQNGCSENVHGDQVPILPAVKNVSHDTFALWLSLSI